MQGCESAKHFYTGGDGDNYCGGCKVGSCVYVYANCEHVMGSNNEPQKADGHYGSDHAHVAERFFFASIVGNNVRDYAESGKNQNINFRVAKESK